MLNAEETLAVATVLQDLVAGTHVDEQDLFNLIGVELDELQDLASKYPNTEGVSLESLDLAVHNVLNLYLNGLPLSDSDWVSGLVVQRIIAERAFKKWQSLI